MFPQLGECKSVGSGEFRYNCPLCIKRVGKHDSDFHLYVNPTRFRHGIRGWYNCYRCGAKGPLRRLIKGGFEETNVGAWSDFVRQLKGYTTPIRRQRLHDDVMLPEDYHKMSKITGAYSYLKKRGITDDQIRFYHIGFGVQDLRDVPLEERKRYAGTGRVIIPDHDDDGNILYWVARTYRNHKLRYKNPKAEVRQKVFNLCRAVKYDTVIITEGVFSAIAAGFNAVATYGKNVSIEQIGMLVAAGFSHYNIAFDGDAKAATVSLSEQLTRRGCSCSVTELPYAHDPDSIDDFQQYSDDAVPYEGLENKVSILMNRRK